jgi:hypothetical protein
MLSSPVFGIHIPEISMENLYSIISGVIDIWQGIKYFASRVILNTLFLSSIMDFMFLIYMQISPPPV